jgi:type IV pilus assembly protein PilZ
MSTERKSTIPPGSERRSHDRFPVAWSVDCSTEDTFLFASITNISEMGIFIQTREPLALGTEMVLSFSPPGHQPFKLRGAVAWINPYRENGDNPNPGMGVRFANLSSEERERIVEIIHTIAYVREPD